MRDTYHPAALGRRASARRERDGARARAGRPARTTPRPPPPRVTSRAPPAPHPHSSSPPEYDRLLLSAPYTMTHFHLTTPRTLSTFPMYFIIESQPNLYLGWPRLTEAVRLLAKWLRANGTTLSGPLSSQSRIGMRRLILSEVRWYCLSLTPLRIYHVLIKSNVNHMSRRYNLTVPADHVV